MTAFAASRSLIAWVSVISSSIRLRSDARDLSTPSKAATKRGDIKERALRLTAIRQDAASDSSTSATVRATVRSKSAIMSSSSARRIVSAGLAPASKLARASKWCRLESTIRTTG